MYQWLVRIRIRPIRPTSMKIIQHWHQTGLTCLKRFSRIVQTTLHISNSCKRCKLFKASQWICILLVLFQDMLLNNRDIPIWMNLMRIAGSTSVNKWGLKESAKREDQRDIDIETIRRDKTTVIFQLTARNLRKSEKQHWWSAIFPTDTTRTPC